MKDLKKILDRFYLEYDFEERVAHDPIEIPRGYADPRDQEMAGFIAASLAYGRVDLFKPIAKRILSKMGGSPYGFISGFSWRRQKRLFEGIKYRFNEQEDILAFLHILHVIVRKQGALENVFRAFYRNGHRSIREGLAGMTATLLAVDASGIYGTERKPPGLLQFFPSPLQGSPCKRGNMFLRWMIRDRDIDLGIWKGIPKNRLVIPLDTHIARISRCLGFTQRKSQDWKMAEEITEALKRLDPEDPLKYDFALCHQGISGLCKGRGKTQCSACDFT